MKNQTKNRLSRQMDFLSEIEKLKTVYRQNGVVDGSRFENSAEHSWHAALYALILAEYAPDTAMDHCRTLELLLIHDLAEVYAGDTFLYDEAGKADAAIRESEAAIKLFGLLPDGQRERYLSLWREFEERATPEARFAACMDALQPVINHYLTGQPDKGPLLAVSRVRDKKRFVGEIAPELWTFTETILERCVEKGLYSPD